ncbi:MAG: inositol monophosphatase, partial [Parvibaculaceae bacterium]|nr:inositol monophosphatase [Parvibaculaceae bacterium]
NNRRLRVANRRDINQAVVCTGIPHMGRGNHSQALSELAAVMPHVAGIRRTGSAALDLAYVAAGRFDGFWESDLSTWDMAAGLIILREAGGFATDINGGEQIFKTKSVVATNDVLARPLLELIRKGRRSAPTPE